MATYTANRIGSTTTTIRPRTTKITVSTWTPDRALPPTPRYFPEQVTHVIMKNAVLQMTLVRSCRPSTIIPTPVRRHMNWNKFQFELVKSLAHLVCHIKRRTYDVASASFQLSFA